jgi:hypothetical protein
MPSSKSIYNIKLSPMLKILGKGTRDTVHAMETMLTVLVTGIFMIFTLVIYNSVSLLFHLWDSVMMFSGRKQEITENTDQGKETIYMIRYVIWFKDTDKTNKFNIFINHYITSTNDYTTQPWKSCSLILYGMLREDYEVKNKDKQEEGPTKVRRTWNSVLHYPKDSIKYIIKPNTTCWELVITKKKLEDKKKE